MGAVGRRDTFGGQQDATGWRLAVYVLATLAGSAVGSLFTHRESSAWADADPLASSLHGLWSLGAAAVIAAFAPLARSLVALVALGFATAMVVMWWRFATSESSTAALVFLSGWLFGIPLSATLVAATRWRARRGA
jgi:hypothetical protein